MLKVNCRIFFQPLKIAAFVLDKLVPVFIYLFLVMKVSYVSTFSHIQQEKHANYIEALYYFRVYNFL